MTNTNYPTSKVVVSISMVLILVLGFILLLAIAIPSAKAATSPNVVIGRDLTVGSTGQDVVVLQGLLSEMGYLNVPAGVPFGYYGPLTQSAVARYQSSLSVSPSVGYFGSITKTAMYQDFFRRGWLPLLGW